MVETVSSSNSGQPERSTDGPGDLAQLPAPVVKAVETFAAAAHTRRIENICKAYEALKSSVNGLGIQYVLPLADKIIGQSTVALVVSAYSHEKCFMCANGSVPCESCSEDDADPQAKCTHCN